MMGKISESATNSGGKVIGIIPRFLNSKEIINTVVRLVEEKAREIENNT